MHFTCYLHRVNLMQILHSGVVCMLFIDHESYSKSWLIYWGHLDLDFHLRCSMNFQIAVWDAQNSPFYAPCEIHRCLNWSVNHLSELLWYMCGPYHLVSWSNLAKTVLKISCSLGHIRTLIDQEGPSFCVPLVQHFVNLLGKLPFAFEHKPFLGAFGKDSSIFTFLSLWQHFANDSQWK